MKTPFAILATACLTLSVLWIGPLSGRALAEAAEASYETSEPRSSRVEAAERLRLAIANDVPLAAGRDNVLRSTGGESGSLLVFVFGQAAGATPLSGCSNGLSISQPTVLGTAIVGESGEAELSFFLPAEAVGQKALVQVLDQSRCRISAVLESEIS